MPRPQNEWQVLENNHNTCAAHTTVEAYDGRGMPRPYKMCRWHILQIYREYCMNRVWHNHKQCAFCISVGSTSKTYRLVKQ